MRERVDRWTKTERGVPSPGSRPVATSRSHGEARSLGAWLLRFLGAAGLLVSTASPGYSQYLPLAEGYSWIYQQEGTGVPEGLTVAGQIPLFGGLPWSIDYGPSPTNEGLSNFWTSTAGGDVFLWGFYRSPEDFGLAYDPPIQMVKAPLALGDSWTQSVSVYSYPGLDPLGTLEVLVQVEEEGVLVVPAGEFPAFGLGLGVAAGASWLDERFTLTGALAEPARSATDWWTLGVGRVQYDADARYQLASFNFPVPSLGSSWGEVKAKFRDEDGSGPPR